MKPVIPISEAEVFFDGVFSEPQLNHPEGLAFDREGRLWCGGERGEIYRFGKEGETIELVASTGGFSLGMAFDREDHLYVCDNKHAAVFRLNTKTGELALFSVGGEDEHFRIPNFPVIDHVRECLYVSDSYGFRQTGPGVWKIDLKTGKGILWYKEPMNFANGMALALDGSALYVAETFGRQVSRIPILENGEAGKKEVVATLDALPDGLALDAQGNIYVCCYEPSLIYRIRADHRKTELLIHDPEAHTFCHPTNCAFLGKDLYTANLGRWHITKFHVGVEGAPLI